MTDFVGSLTATAISEDATLMATGFADSHIRIWSLKGEKLRSATSDFDPASVNTGVRMYCGCH